MSDLVYSFDSSALIHAWRRAYRPKNFPSFWRLMEELAHDGRFKISSEVYGELESKDDDVFAWCKAHKAEIFVDIDEDVQDRVIEIMGAYPRIVDTKKGKSGGDPFVIAIASCGKDISAVVTEENPGGNRIPQVCSEEQIDCVNLADLIEREGWIL
jgi:hypothetical protein